MGTDSKLKRIVVHLVGWSFVLLGIAGLVLPILQGILFLLVGLFILSTVSPWAARLLHRIRKRFPRISKQFDQAKSKAKVVQGAIAKRFDGAKSKVRRVHAHVIKRRPRPSED